MTASGDSCASVASFEWWRWRCTLDRRSILSDADLAGAPQVELSLWNSVGLARHPAVVLTEHAPAHRSLNPRRHEALSRLRQKHSIARPVTTVLIVHRIFHSPARVKYKYVRKIKLKTKFFISNIFLDEISSSLVFLYTNFSGFLQRRVRFWHFSMICRRSSLVFKQSDLSDNFLY